MLLDLFIRNAMINIGAILYLVRRFLNLRLHATQSEAKLLDQAASIEELKMRADESAKAAMVSADKQRNACTENEL